MSIKLEWSNPPEQHTGQQAERARVVEKLKEQPGKWALVETHVYASTRKSWQRLGCEASTRRRVTEDDGNGSTAYTHDVYARWPEPTPNTRVKGTPGIVPPSPAGGYLAGREFRNVPKEGKKR